MYGVTLGYAYTVLIVEDTPISLIGNIKQIHPTHDVIYVQLWFLR